MTFARKRSAQEDDFHMFDFSSVRQSMINTSDEASSMGDITTQRSLRAVSPLSMQHDEEFDFRSGFPPTIQRLSFPQSARGEERNVKRHRFLESYPAQYKDHQSFNPSWQRNPDKEKSPLYSRAGNPDKITVTPPLAPWWKTCPTNKEAHSVMEKEVHLAEKCEICLHPASQIIEKRANAHARNMKQCSILSFMNGSQKPVQVCSPESSPCVTRRHHTKQCTHCDRIACSDCCDECVACLRTFCKGCSIVNYDASREDRNFCLECHANAGCSNGSIEDCERMDLD